MEKYLQKYYENNAKKLKTVVDSILKRFGGIPPQDIEEFYDVANETFTQALKTYDNTQNFDAFIRACLIKKIKTHITRRRRQKRGNGTALRSLDEIVSEDGEITLGDTISSDFDIFEKFEKEPDKEFKDYCNSLSKIQKQIVELIIRDYNFGEIKRALKISDAQFNTYLKDLKSFEKISLLKRKGNVKPEEKREEVGKMTKTNISNETSKDVKYSNNYIIEHMNNKIIRFDHPAQRQSDQWTPIIKSNLISDILQKNPLPELVFAEEVIGGISIIWDLDGKQRCTTIQAYKEDRFKISKSVEIPVIRYQAIKRDENGEVILDEKKVPVFEIKECDIRNKKYSQLPKELQDIFNEFSFKVVLYINCTQEQILYHIKRYNSGKPMNIAQKGIISLGTEFIEITKSIANMSFFKDVCGFSDTQYKNGSAPRTVIDSLVLAKYINDYKKNLNDMCKFICKNASYDDFDLISDAIERLEKIVPKDLTEIFTVTNVSYLIALFVKFAEHNIPDEEFAKFLHYYKEYNIEEKIMAVLKELSQKGNGNEKIRNTKDISFIKGKMKILISFMERYFDIEHKAETVPAAKCSAAKTDLAKKLEESDFAKAMGYTDCNNIAESSVKMAKKYCPKCDEADILAFFDILNDWSFDIKNESVILSEDYIPADIGIIAYIYENEIGNEAKQWFVKISEQEDIPLENDCEKITETLLKSMLDYVESQKGNQVA